MEKQLTIASNNAKEVWTWEIQDTHVYVTYKCTQDDDPDWEEFSFQYVPKDVFEAIMTDYEST